MIRTQTLAAAAALALALPATAQERAPAAGETWNDVSQPKVRLIQRGADGTILFDSDAVADAPGAEGEMAEAIARADGETIAATDADAEMAEADAEAAPMDEAAPSGAPVAAGEAAADPARTATTEDRRMASDEVPFDLEEFAREMFEQGYRQGYVSGMTRVRADAARTMRERADERGPDRAAFREQAREQRQALRRALPGLYRDEQGRTYVVLPEGVDAQQVLRQLDR